MHEPGRVEPRDGAAEGREHGPDARGVRAVRVHEGPGRRARHALEVEHAARGVDAQHRRRRHAPRAAARERASLGERPVAPQPAVERRDAVGLAVPVLGHGRQAAEVQAVDAGLGALREQAPVVPGRRVRVLLLLGEGRHDYFRTSSQHLCSTSNP